MLSASETWDMTRTRMWSCVRITRFLSCTMYKMEVLQCKCGLENIMHNLNYSLHLGLPINTAICECQSSPEWWRDNITRSKLTCEIVSETTPHIITSYTATCHLSNYTGNQGSTWLNDMILKNFLLWCNSPQPKTLVKDY